MGLLPTMLLTAAVLAGCGGLPRLALLKPSALLGAHNRTDANALADDTASAVASNSAPAATIPPPTGQAEASDEPSSSAPSAAARPTRAPAPTTATTVRPKPAAAGVIPSAGPNALAAASEADFAAGVAHYQAGELDAARASFNSALDRLLTSPYDLRQTPELSAEYARLVDRIHALEMDALRAGDGFSAPPPPPAPIASVADLTFPVDAATRAEVERQIKNTSGDLPLMLTDPVIRYIHYFSTPGGRQYLEASYRRAGRYRAMIESTLKQVGVPEDLIYLAQAESSFNPFCVSRAGARGIWQFMGSRADDYGLKRNWWVDERQDPKLSTLAAARHLRDLHEQFGDWYLAMAAYDAGPGTIERAVAESGYADFWRLYKLGLLPRETRNYVPIIIAMALIAKNPRQYGLDRLPSDPPLRTDAVTLDAPVDLRLAAEITGVSVTEMQELNPSLLRLTTPNSPGFVLRVPAGSKAEFLAALARIPPDMRVRWRYHEVEAGESVYAIARRYHASAERIAAVNNLDLSQDPQLRPGESLIIPIRADPPDHLRYTRAETHYRARRGDTVRSVAERFGVSEVALRRWNHLRGSRLAPGRRLAIHFPVRERVSAPRVSRLRRRRPEAGEGAGGAALEALDASARGSE